MTWRHVEQFGRACMVPVGFDQYIDSCGCTTPTPDPASPCGSRNQFGPCNWTLDEHRWARVNGSATAHPYQPTRCLTCGHPIEEARP